MERNANTSLDADTPGFLNAGSGAVLVEITTPWCGNGHLLSPIVRRALNHFDGQVSHCTVDADYRPDILRTYAVHKVPTLLFIKDGELVGSLTGTLPEKELITRIGEYFEIHPNTHTEPSGGRHE